MARVTGIETRHSRSCHSRGGGACSCRPSFQAHIWSSRDGRRIRKTFPTLAAARAWRADATVALHRGELRASPAKRLKEAADELLAGMEDGSIRAKGGRPYRASTVSSYRASLERHVLPSLGQRRLTEIAAVDVQLLVDRLVRAGLSGSTVRNVVNSISTVYRYARRRGLVTINPCRQLELPQGAKRRERIVDPSEAKRLLDPLPLELRALYACGIFAGLRRGEIAGLTWSDVRFDDGVLTVRRSYCWRAKAFQDPKSTAGVRITPMVAPLAAILLEHRMASGSTDLVFPAGGDVAKPFDPRSVARRAERAWKQNAQRRARAAGEDPESVTWNRIVLHEGRHSAASAFIASGRDPVRVAEWMGHSQVSTTLNIYSKAFQARLKQDSAAVDAFYESFQPGIETASRPQ